MSSSWTGVVLSSDSVTDRSLSPIGSVSSTSSISSLEEFNMHKSGMTSSSDLTSPTMADPDIREHSKYYFEERNAKFIVENTLYSLPCLPLTRHSTFFYELLQTEPANHLPPGWTAHELEDGLTVYIHSASNKVQRARPIIAGSRTDVYPLTDVTSSEFDAFLSVLYPDNYATLDLSTADEWTTVLKLATRWHFSSIRELAISRLHPLLLDAPLDRLIAARTCGIDAWVDDALESLVERREPLTEDDVARMVIGDVVDVTRRREAESEARVVASLRADPFLASPFESKDKAEHVAREEQQRRLEEEEKARREQVELEKLTEEREKEEAALKARAEAEAKARWATQANARADAAAAAVRSAAKRKAKDYASAVKDERAAERKRGGKKGDDDSDA